MTTIRKHQINWKKIASEMLKLWRKTEDENILLRGNRFHLSNRVINLEESLEWAVDLLDEIEDAYDYEGGRDARAKAGAILRGGEYDD